LTTATILSRSACSDPSHSDQTHGLDNPPSDRPIRPPSAQLYRKLDSLRRRRSKENSPHHTEQFVAHVLHANPVRSLSDQVSFLGSPRGAPVTRTFLELVFTAAATSATPDLTVLAVQRLVEVSA
jgi:hypothetical protein